MDIEKILLDYAKAWVALHTQSITGWPSKRILDVYYMLPEPEVSFDDWCIARGHKNDKEEPQVMPHDGIEQGEGWAVAHTEEAKNKMEAQLKKLEKLAKRTSK
jgi:hypothetical protein